MDGGVFMMNRSVGGSPTVLFPQFALRATQDTLSLGLSVMKSLLKNPRFNTHVHSLLDISTPQHVDHVQLIKDPSSIPLNLPSQPENLYRRKLKEGLPSLASVAAIFGAQADEEETHYKIVAVIQYRSTRESNGQICHYLLYTECLSWHLDKMKTPC